LLCEEQGREEGKETGKNEKDAKQNGLPIKCIARDIRHEQNFKNEKQGRAKGLYSPSGRIRKKNGIKLKSRSTKGNRKGKRTWVY